jgi:hypothetical protein
VSVSTGRFGHQGSFGFSFTYVAGAAQQHQPLTKENLDSTVSQLANLDPKALAAWAESEKQAAQAASDPASIAIVAAASQLADAASQAASKAVAPKPVSTQTPAAPREIGSYPKLRRMMGWAR